MSDCEKINLSSEISTCYEQPKSRRSKRKQKNERDDLPGLMLNMASKLDPRELFILWIAFIFTHTSMFVEHFLKKVKGTTNKNDTMTIKGVFYASLFMLLVIIVCRILF